MIEEKLKVLDLFSGIGGFSLGLEATGGFETVAFCEIEKFPQLVLKKHWPNVRIYEDVRKLTKSKLASDGIAKIDVVTGGFPCQDVSLAGKLAGIGKETRSGLWSECVHLVSEIRPSFAVFENVTNLLSGPTEQKGAWFSRILCDLAQIGYDAEWHDIPASFVGAWHRRGRAWILAYPNENSGQQRSAAEPILRQRHLQEQSTRSFEKWPGRQNLPTPTLCGAHDGVPHYREWIGAFGNSVIPQIPELIGRAILEHINSGNPAE